MKKRSASCFCAVLCGAVFLVSQAWPQTLKPSPELKKHDFFVGTWRLEGMTKSSPFGSGGEKFQSTEHLEWMPGGFFLIAHSYSNEKLAGVTVIGYDSNEKVFTHTSFNSTGETEFWRGTTGDDSWIWMRDTTINSKPVKERLTIKKTSSNSYSFVDEMKPAEGGNWSIMAEGTGTKTK